MSWFLPLRVLVGRGVGEKGGSLSTREGSEKHASQCALLVGEDMLRYNV